MRNQSIIYLTIVFLFLGLLGCQKKVESVKTQDCWEYKVVLQATLMGFQSMNDAIKGLEPFGDFEKTQKNNQKMEDSMNVLGKDGWELISIGPDYRFTFKRRIK